MAKDIIVVPLGLLGEPGERIAMYRCRGCGKYFEREALDHSCICSGWCREMVRLRNRRKKRREPQERGPSLFGGEGDA